MKTIEYKPWAGQVFTDDEVEIAARRFLVLPNDSCVAVANATFITAVRALINERVVDHTDVRFIYREEVILPNAQGRLPSWPGGFCDLEDRLVARILSVQFSGEQR